MEVVFWGMISRNDQSTTKGFKRHVCLSRKEDWKVDFWLGGHSLVASVYTRVSHFVDGEDRRDSYCRMLG